MLSVAALFIAAACTDPEAARLGKIVGEWHCTRTESGVQIDVYVAFSQDYTFELFQKIGDGPHYLYTGKYGFDGEVLSGTYDDYTPWGNDYKVSRSGNTLVLTSVSDPEYSMTYAAETIPEAVRTHYMPVTKGSGKAPAPLF